MKIHIMDAGLAVRAGHHYDFDLKLARHLAATGHEVQVYGYDRMRDDVFADFSAICPVHRLFKFFQYAEPLRFDSIAPDMVSFHLQSEVLAEELATVAPADAWIWPSFDVQHLMACAAVGTAPRVIGCVHFDPGHDRGTVPSMLWRLALLEARRKGLDFILGSVEPELRHRFMPLLTDGRFAVFPHPYEGPPRKSPSAALERIGFFGQMRGEKGTALMRPLIEALLGEGYTVIAQSSTDGLELPDHPRCERLGFVPDFAAPIAGCDAVVLPYEPQHYRDKGSGLLMQALALGVPVVGPVGTMPGRVIEQYQAGPLFSSATPQAVFDTIKVLDRHYARFAESAIEAGKMYAYTHGIERYAATMLSFARQRGGVR